MVAGVLGHQLFAAIKKGPEGAEDTARYKATIEQFLNVKDPQRQKTLAEAALAGISPLERWRYLVNGNIPDILSPYVTIPYDLEVKDLANVNTVKAVLGKPAAAPRVFGIPDRLAVLSRRLSAIFQQKEKLDPLAKTISEIVQKANRDTLEITTDEFVRLVKLFPSSERGGIVWALAAIGGYFEQQTHPDTLTARAQTDAYYDNLILLIDAHPLDSLNTRFTGSSAERMLNSFLDKADLVNTLMERSEVFKERVAQKMHIDVIEKSLYPDMPDKYYLSARYNFLQEIALAAVCYDPGDLSEFHRMRNPVLASFLAGEKRLMTQAIRDFFNDYKGKYFSKYELTQTFATRLFRFLAGHLPADQYPSDISIENIRHEIDQTNFSQGLKTIGSSLGIDWRSVNSWDDVKRFLEAQGQASTPAARPEGV